MSENAPSITVRGYRIRLRTRRAVDLGWLLLGSVSLIVTAWLIGGIVGTTPVPGVSPTVVQIVNGFLVALAVFVVLIVAYVCLLVVGAVLFEIEEVGEDEPR